MFGLGGNKNRNRRVGKETRVKIPGALLAKLGIAAAALGAMGIAVTLGVGAAIASSPGIAYADSTGTSQGDSQQKVDAPKDTENKDTTTGQRNSADELRSARTDDGVGADEVPGPDADELDADNAVEQDTIETLDPENPPA